MRTPTGSRPIRRRGLRKGGSGIGRRPQLRSDARRRARAELGDAADRRQGGSAGGSRSGEEQRQGFLLVRADARASRCAPPPPVQVLQVGTVRVARQPDAQPRARHGAGRAPYTPTAPSARPPAVPLGELGRTRRQPEPLARDDGVRDRRAQHEGRVPGRAHGRGHRESRQRSEPRLHVQQRRVRRS